MVTSWSQKAGGVALDGECVFCSEKSSRSGEHVIPKAVLNELFPNGQAAGDGYKFDFDGKAHTSLVAPRIHAPCCEHHNGVLQRRFETPYQKDVLTVLNKSNGWTLDASARRGAGLWMLKTCLLLAHPSITFRSSKDVVQPPAGMHLWRTEGIEPLLAWMVDGRPPPDSLSVWVSSSESSVQLPGCSYLPLFDYGRVRYEGNFKAVKINGIWVRLLYHPGVRVDGLCPGAQLWPPVDASLGVDDLCAGVDDVWLRLAGFAHLTLTPKADPLGNSWMLTDPVWSGVAQALPIGTSKVDYQHFVPVESPIAQCLPAEY